jgi:hypothetical protein
VAERDRIAESKEEAELMPEDPVVWFGLAGAYLEAGQAESAIIEYAETNDARRPGLRTRGSRWRRGPATSRRRKRSRSSSVVWIQAGS